MSHRLGEIFQKWRKSGHVVFDSQAGFTRNVRSKMFANPSINRIARQAIRLTNEYKITLAEACVEATLYSTRYQRLYVERNWEHTLTFSYHGKEYKHAFKVGVALRAALDTLPVFLASDNCDEVLFQMMASLQARKQMGQEHGHYPIIGVWTGPRTRVYMAELRGSRMVFEKIEGLPNSKALAELLAVLVSECMWTAPCEKCPNYELQLPNLSYRNPRLPQKDKDEDAPVRDVFRFKLHYARHCFLQGTNSAAGLDVLLKEIPLKRFYQVKDYNATLRAQIKRHKLDGALVPSGTVKIKGIEYAISREIVGMTVADSRVYSAAVAMTYTRQFMALMKRLFNLKIVHRDIKCANVCIDVNEDKLYLIDWEGEWVRGTPGYCAPELEDPERGLDRYTDLYAAGMVVQRLWEYAEMTGEHLIVKQVIASLMSKSREERVNALLLLQ